MSSTKASSTASSDKGQRKRSNSSDSSADSPKKKKAPVPHQVNTERDPLPRLWNANEHPESYTFRVASWNVAGLRALLKNHPKALPDLVEKYNLDLLCLQETKLQEQHVEDPKLQIQQVLQDQQYDSHWSCSIAKKGYSGTAAFVRRCSMPAKKQTTLDAFVKTTKTETTSPRPALSIQEQVLQPVQISFGLGNDKHDQEGRVIVLDYPMFTLINLYVPNSGQKLERLDYRTEEWDKDLLAFVQQKQAERGVPVIWLGDLNVAHKALDIWNEGAKHLPKQAGVTPQERASFQAQLDAGYIDAFRYLYPEAKGHYSYWSGRAGNREPNKGLRLDYFVCDPTLFDDKQQVVVRDSYMVHEQMGSDHCPVVLELEIRQQAK